MIVNRILCSWKNLFLLHVYTQPVPTAALAKTVLVTVPVSMEIAITSLEIVLVMMDT